MDNNRFFINNEWAVEPSANRILHNGEDFKIPDKFMQVLLLLVQNKGKVMNRQEIMDAIWQDEIVVEESLTRAISELRKIFGDNPKASKYIETIPKKGYRFIAEITASGGSPIYDESGANGKDSNRLWFPRIKKTHSLFAIIVLLVLSWMLGVYFKTSVNDNVFYSGFRPIQLTSLRGQEVLPDISPDGEHVVFSWKGENQDNFDIYIQHLTSRTLSRLTATPKSEIFPAWSHDGKLIAYSLKGGENCGIFVKPANGGIERTLVDSDLHDCPYRPAFSPNGKWLVYLARPALSQSVCIFLYSLETQETRQITFLDSPLHYDSSPEFSPDSKYIAFIRKDDIHRKIALIPTEGGDVSIIYSGGIYVNDLDWMPNGEEIAFSSNSGLWKISRFGGQPQFFAAGNVSVMRISIAQQASRIAYEQTFEERNIWQMDIESGQASQPRIFIASTRYDADPTYSPDGKLVAFRSSRTGSMQIWIAEAENSNQFSQATSLTDFRGCSVEEPAWSPDGKHIAFVAYPKGHAEIYITDLLGQKMRLFTPASWEEMMPSWSRDGKSIYFTSNHSGEWQIWKRPVSGGEAIQITTVKGRKAMESFDETSVYFTRTDADTIGIWEKDAMQSEAKLIMALPNGHLADWTLTPDGILYGYHDNHCTSLKIVLFDLHEKSHNPVAAADSLSYSFDISPDGKSILYDKFERIEGDIMGLEELQ